MGIPLLGYQALSGWGEAVFATYVEEEFSEVHGSKLPWSGWPLGLWGGAMRPSPTLYLQGSPPMWQGIVASGYDLLRPRLPRISRLDALMRACAILVIGVAMTTMILVIMSATRSLERGLFAYPVSRISIQCHKM
jgi:hypothetical protein